MRSKNILDSFLNSIFSPATNICLWVVENNINFSVLSKPHGHSSVVSL